MKWWEDMSVKAKAVSAICSLMGIAAGVVIWLFTTFTLASAFGEHKDKEEMRDAYAMRLQLRQEVASCEEAKKKPGGLSDFMKTACVQAEEEYKMKVEEIQTRWGAKK